MSTNKRKQRPAPQRAPTNHPTPAPAAASAVEEVGAEDESAADAQESRDKANHRSWAAGSRPIRIGITRKEPS